MVQVNVSRVTVETLAATADSAKCTKVGVEAVVDANDASTAQVNVSRLTVEILRKNIIRANATKVSVEASVKSSAASTGQANVSRVGVEILRENPPRANATKAGSEAVVDSNNASTAQVNVSRLGLEVLARRGSSSVIAKSLALGAEIFLHNWADQVEMESSFQTDVAASAVSGSEERCGLVQKPKRVLTLTWLSNEATRLDRMVVTLRKMTEVNIQVPLYQDLTEISIASLTGAGNATIQIDTTQARFFQGGRVAIVHLDAALQVASVDFYIIGSKTSNTMTFTVPLTADVEIGAVVFPMIDVDIVLDPEIKWRAGKVASVSLTVEEFVGASQLPTMQSDDPSGFRTYQGLPIFNLEPDWIQEVRRGYNRQGERYTRGKKSVTYIAAARARGTEHFSVTGDRAVGLSFIRFFETRRGRLRSFFQIDQEYLWTIQANAGGVFIDVDKLGTFSDFLVALDLGYVGFVLQDGTPYVRQVVTVQDLPSSWRITVTDPLPALDQSLVYRFARARKVRCVEDAMTERWQHASLFSGLWSVVELLEEKDVTP